MTIKLIGFTDNVPLSERNARIYGNHLTLSKARAHRAALTLQEALDLLPEAIISDGRGASTPVATNGTAQGRAANRRIEVEFWHDDPLTELPEDPRLCPGAPGSEVVTKVYDPPWGSIAPLQLEQGGRAVIPADYAQQLRRAMTDIAGKTNVRLRFIGYTKNERLDRRTAIVYGDDIGLAAARARRAMDTIVQEMDLTPAQAEHEGRGYVQSRDVVSEGFTQDGDSHIVAQVVYDEPAILDDYEGVDIETLTRELSPKNPFALNLMRITVDGEPLDDPGRSSADIQRCTDVALDRADIAFQFDNLQSSPRLSVSAWPTTVTMAELSEWVELAALGQAADEGQIDHESDESAEPEPSNGAAHESAEPAQESDEGNESGDGAKSEAESLAESVEGIADATETEASEELAEIRVRDALMLITPSAEEMQIAQGDTPQLHTVRLFGTPVRFRTYANYSAFIDRSEVRIFQADQSTQATPLEVLPVDAAGFAEWEPTAEQSPAPMRELQYVLRAYDKDGNFDETNPQPLWLVLERPTQIDLPPQAAPPKELLAGYGATALTVRNIPLSSGTIKVRGSSIPTHHSVWVAGNQVPVDPLGNFLAEEILPAGMHTVEVAVLDEKGNGTMFLRDLEFERNDWFYVGIADVTASESHTRGPADLLQGENAPYDYDSSLDAPPGVLRERQVQRGLAHQRQRRYARGSGQRAVQQLPQQGPRLAVPAHRSGLSLSDLRRRLGRRRSRADARQDVRETLARRKSRDVGQLQDQLRRQRTRAGRSRAVRRQSALPVRGQHELRRATFLGRRLRRRARYAGQPRGIPRHRRLAVLPAQPGHPGRLRAAAHRIARQGFRPG